jgi:flagellar hook protein FlgE
MTLSSLYSGVSGLNASGYTMSVIGNNIANSNTVGFKSSYTSFADLLSGSLGGVGGGLQVGRGVNLTEIGTVFNQGNFENTTNGTDLAIEGGGFFMVADSAGTYYTRAGQFILDEEGYMINPSGYRLQGYGIDATGTLQSTVGDINVANASSAPQVTSTFRIASNLDGSAATGDTYSSTVTVYDSLGAAIPLTLTFTKINALNAWSYTASIPGSMGTIDPALTGTGSVEFDTGGNLTTIDGAAAAADKGIFLDLTAGVGGAPFTVDWDLWDATATAATTDLTGYASPSSTSFLSQDGYAPGSLQTLSVNTEGEVEGLFTNGQTRVLGQVLLAEFISPWGLSKVGKSLYTESADSGQPIIGTPGAAGLGEVIANSLELSNVDMASEFVKMITTQRAYQANAKVITTSDELLSVLMSIKR